MRAVLLLSPSAANSQELLLPQFPVRPLGLADEQRQQELSKLGKLLLAKPDVSGSPCSHVQPQNLLGFCRKNPGKYKRGASPRGLGLI